MKARLLIFVVISFLLISCSPLYTLNVQNNTENPADIYVELKDNKFNKNSRKVFEKREMYKYVRIENLDIFPLDSLRSYIQKNQSIQKKYNFSSDLKYSFTLEPNLLTNIDPNNSISIYPFEKVYYIQNNKKCFIVPIEKNEECSIRLHRK